MLSGNITEEDVRRELSRGPQRTFLVPEVTAQLLNRLADIAYAWGDSKLSITSALDINAGPGFLLSRSLAPHRVAVEGSEAAVTIGRQLYPSIIFRNEDPMDFSSKERFDAVISILLSGVRVRQGERQVRLEEVLFDRALSFLNEGGIAVLVTPRLLLTSPRFEAVRRRILSDFALDAVVNLPARALGIPILDTVAWVIRLGTKRSTVFLGEFDGDVNHLLSDFQNGTGDFHVPTQRLRNRLDRHFHDPKFRVLDEQLASSQRRGIPVESLRNIADIRRGQRIPSEYLTPHGDFVVLGPSKIRGGRIQVGEDARFVKRPEADARFESAIVRPGDIVVSLMDRLDWALVRPDDPPAVADPHIAILRSGSGPLGYITAFLKTAQGRELFTAQMDRKSTNSFVRLSFADLGAIQIPILPVSDLEALSDERLDTASENELMRLRGELERTHYRLAASERELEFARQQLEAQGRFADEVQNTVRRELQGQKEFLEERLDRIDGSLAQIHNVVEAIHDQLTEIERIKSLPRSEDDRLAQICSELNTLSQHLLQGRRSLQRYEATVRNWLHNFDRLDATSQQFLPLAELLFDELARIDGADFSPFIIQYSRALENEILQKLFCAYHDDLDVRGIDRREFVAAEVDTEDLKIFARAIRSNNRKYTLGTMNRILQMLKPNGRTLSRSAILQDFREFALRYFEDEVVSAGFLSGVEEINNDFRNKAAHPYVLDLELAQSCQTKIRSILCDWLDAYKSLGLSS